MLPFVGAIIAAIATIIGVRLKSGYLLGTAIIHAVFLRRLRGIFVFLLPASFRNNLGQAVVITNTAVVAVIVAQLGLPYLRILRYLRQYPQ